MGRPPVGLSMYLNLYGLNLVYDVHGRGEPVLLVAETAQAWADAFPIPPGYRFLLPDLPGFGRSEGPPMTPEELAEYPLALVTMLNLGRPKIGARGLGERVGKLVADRLGTDFRVIQDRGDLERWLAAR